ncbi:MAG TPA: SIS domain-containing protein [Baekduia sp.]|uniref:D-sedoheptulose-7-phosphate isomerase n=1 Tax=Baekduia sp. TaxID=2600305 RepID=UPI002D77FA8A|nr:SIS domain-containing protein [Baekduia sp.]HET6505420.1 SIS domain-containing protein [Baekduia sp.]
MTASASAPAAGERYFAEQAPRLAELCHRLSERFADGGRLVAFGAGEVERSDARHVAVEFVHPVIVGKRALPALAVEPGDVALLARPEDVAIAFGGGAAIARAVAVARERGCLTVAFVDDAGAEWAFVPPTADPFVAQELVETTYHVLWELVHVFFEHRSRAGRDAGASSFLYPFLATGADHGQDLEAVLADVAASVLAKGRETAALRAQTVEEGAATLAAAAAALRSRLDGGGLVLALGNGGSATDAMDAVADLRAGGRRALDLTADPAILTAIANDVGTEAIFARQVIAYGSVGDALLAFSTSGNSTNVIAALAEARRRGLLTVAFVGYDGGRVLAEGLADHVVVSRSEHIPRIQEAQATAWHVLRASTEGAR